MRQPGRTANCRREAAARCCSGPCSASSGGLCCAADGRPGLAGGLSAAAHPATGGVVKNHGWPSGSRAV